MLKLASWKQIVMKKMVKPKEEWQSLQLSAALNT